MLTVADLDAAMLRSGRSVPAVNRLGGGTIPMAGTDQPWRVVGARAAVYQLRQPNGRVLALRCPLGDTADHGAADRWRALGADGALRPLREDPPAPLVGGVTYLPDGLTLPAPDFRSTVAPVIAMDWVMGPTLLAATDRAARAGDGPYLAALAGAWLAALDALAAAGVAHGDLTGDNALVRPQGGIALVDYDTLTWPGGPPADPGWPAGSPGYAHPAGRAPRNPARRDDFPGLTVYASLRALAERPDLREAHGDPPGKLGGTLLFAEGDLADPDRSRLFAELRALRDVGLHAVLDALRDAAKGPPDDVPPLGAVVREVRPIRASAPPPRASRLVRPEPESARPEPPLPDPTPLFDARERQRRLTRLNSLLLAGDEDAARSYWDGSGLATDAEASRELGPRMADLERRRTLSQARAAAEANDSATLLRLWEQHDFEAMGAASALRPMVQAARRRLGTVERLRGALDTGDVATVSRLWPEVRGDSLASVLAIRVSDVLAGVFGEAIASAIRRGDDPAVVEAVRDAETAGVPIALPARRAARAAEGRRRTREKLDAALAADDRPALADLVISGRLAELGVLDPETMRRAVRALNWPHLLRALASDDDATISAAYDPEVYGEDPALTPAQRRRIELATTRHAWLEDIRAALRRRDVAALRAARDAAPPGGPDALTPTERTRIERTLERQDALDALAVAMAAGSDDAILEALGRVEQAGATLPPDLDWASIRGMVDRVTIGDAIRRAAAADPPDYGRLARLLSVARAMASADPNLGTGLDLATLEADVLRAASATRLREALDSGDDAEIASAADPDAYGALATLTAAQRARVEEALGRRGARRR